MIQLDKKQARKIAKQARNALNQTLRDCYSQQIINKLQPYLFGKVALYKSYGSEVCVDALFETCDYALPKVLDDTTIAFYQPTTSYTLGAYDILEPISNELVDPNDFDVIVIPLVAFDENCNRLGHGKGYYDRYLSKVKALKIGVAFEVQKLESIEMNEYDIPLDYIISEKAIYQNNKMKKQK